MKFFSLSLSLSFSLRIKVMAFNKISSVSFSAFLLLLLMLFSNFFQPSYTVPPPQNFILTLQWGYTVCKDRPVCLTSKFRREFSIHGLWSAPETKPCVGPYPFIHELFKGPIKSNLEANWFDAENNNNIFLWKHEYERLH